METNPASIQKIKAVAFGLLTISRDGILLPPPLLMVECHGVARRQESRPFLLVPRARRGKDGVARERFGRKNTLAVACGNYRSCQQCEY